MGDQNSGRLYKLKSKKKKNNKKFVCRSKNVMGDRELYLCVSPIPSEFLYVVKVHLDFPWQAEVKFKIQLNH